MTVIHPRRTGSFAGSASQAAIQVLEHFRVGGFALEILLHLVDAPAWPVELIATQLVSRTGRIAETAVHTLAQDRLDRLRMATLLDFGGERGLHAYNPG